MAVPESERPSAGRGVGLGTTLRDRFVLAERLTHGRLGVVFRAEDRLRAGPDGVGQPVAVLILPGEIVRNAKHLESFKREFASVQSLSHPHIVDLYDLDRDGDTHFLVMELVDGESLRSVADSLAPELLSDDEALGVVRAVGEALLYAHARGVVHGDVRAENILVSAHDVKLMFAPACLARSAPFAVEPRDDVYGLASLAYELLSGEPPPATGLQRPAGRQKAPEPRRIKGLGRGEWSALRSALAVREERTRNVRQFLTGLGVPERELARHARVPRASRGAARRTLRRAGIAVAVMAGIVVAVAGVLQVGRQGFEQLAALLPGPSASTDAAAGKGPGETRPDGADAARQAGAPNVAADTGVAADPSTAVTEAAGTTEAAASARPSAVAEDRGPAATDADGAAEGESTEAAAPSAGEALAGTASERTASEARASEETEATAAAGRTEREATEPAGIEAREPAEARPDAEGYDAPTGAPEDDTGPRSASRDEVREAREVPAAPPEASAEPPTAAAAAAAAPRGGALRFDRQEAVVTEGQSAVTIEVRRDGASGETIVVWWTSDGTAEAGDDYADLGRVVERIDEGERNLTILVPIASDSRPEGTEHFSIQASELSADGEQRGPLLEARITIVDDDF